MGLVLRIGSVVCAVALAASAAGDTLTLKSGDVTGEFVEYKLGRIHFKQADGEAVEPMRQGVVSLVVKPPAKVSVRFSSQKRREDLRLSAYRDGQFVFDDKGAELSVAATEVSQMRTDPFDFARAAAAPQRAERVDGAGEAVDLAALARTGTVTIVYVQNPQLAANLRQGNYVETLESRYPGKVKVLKVEVASWDSPTAVKNGIASAPQFWFFNRRGAEVSRLVDRFTDADIDAALKDAMR
jgi:hypothetical protein